MRKYFNQTLKRTLTASVAAILCATTLSFGSIAEDVTETHICCGGVIPESDEVFMEHLARESNIEKDGVALRSGYPSKVDLSTSKYFPAIGSQGGVGSCTAFSTVYYQFTYEANKLNDITTTEENAYSPQWPFYYLRSYESNGGVAVTKTYEFLKEHGALHIADNPYNTEYDSTHPLSSDVSKMREALNTRVEDYTSIEISEPITSPKDSDLNLAKSYLNSGKILRASSFFSFNSVTSGNDTIMYRCFRSSSGHSFVIVGYDDTISYDVNGNGVIEQTEKGAFKIANSWGKRYGNNGYAWILYDALNAESAISGNWEASLTGTRVPAFSYETDSNWLTAMTVKNYKVDYIAELSFENAKREAVKPNLIKEKNNGVTSAEVQGPKSPKVSSFTLVFDYSKVCSGVEADNCNFSFGINLNGTVKNLSSESKITDNRGNKIADLSAVASQEGSYRAPINLIRGDINYNGTITNADVVLVTRYCSGWDNLSNVQIYLADYNGDGKVTNTDVILMQRYITSNS